MSRKIDETGNVYGKLTVINLAETERKGVYWNCVCECGNITTVRGGHLRSGKIKSCGCFSAELTSRRSLINEAGNTYGRWSVISYVGNSKWLCKCTCGTIKEVLVESLRSGKSKSCGCLAQEINYKNEVGNIYGNLLILGGAGRDKYGASLWRCLCSCGNKIITRGSSLRSGNTKSCGCLQKNIASTMNYKNEVGHRFGRLLVLKDVGRTKRNKVLWLCKCDCGKNIVVKAQSLRSGNTRSCGCYQKDRVKEALCIPGNTREYSEEWSNKFREFIRRRDNYMCAVCFTTQEEYGRKLSVHHIDYDKQNTTEENCITLCTSCHMKTNYHRKAWKKFFKELKEKDNGKD